MAKPTPVDRDQRLLAFIGEYTLEHGYAPTYREMAEYLDIAIKSVRDSLTRLRNAGLLTWQEGLTRTLRLTEAEPIP